MAKSQRTWLQRRIRNLRHVAIACCVLLAIPVAIDWGRSFSSFESWRFDSEWLSATFTANSGNGHLDINCNTPAIPPEQSQPFFVSQVQAFKIGNGRYSSSPLVSRTYPTRIPFSYISSDFSTWQDFDGLPLPYAPLVHSVFTEHWFIVACLGILITLLVSPDVIRLIKASKKRGGCKVCGYDLRATPTRCPECGTTPDPKSIMETPATSMDA